VESKTNPVGSYNPEIIGVAYSSPDAKRDIILLLGEFPGVLVGRALAT